jgi:hypothetical protein
MEKVIYVDFTRKSRVARRGVSRKIMNAVRKKKELAHDWALRQRAHAL